MEVSLGHLAHHERWFFPIVVTLWVSLRKQMSEAVKGSRQRKKFVTPGSCETSSFYEENFKRASNYLSQLSMWSSFLKLHKKYRIKNNLDFLLICWQSTRHRAWSRCWWCYCTRIYKLGFRAPDPLCQHEQLNFFHQWKGAPNNRWKSDWKAPHGASTILSDAIWYEQFTNTMKTKQTPPKELLWEIEWD